MYLLIFLMWHVIKGDSKYIFTLHVLLMDSYSIVGIMSPFIKYIINAKNSNYFLQAF